jgi:uncharacterized protein (TIGR00661 family)
MERVLVAPLDWGLGHATRCIPVIRELQLQDCEVLIAGSGDSLELLRQEFPHLKTFHLPGYRPRYPAKGSMALRMACQLPKFWNVISAEHKAISRLIEKENINKLISDNRYGCWSPKIPCAFITHQSNILMPQRFGWLQHSVRRLSDYLINRFSTCWIPDFPAGHSLAGDLISFKRSGLKIEREYIGWLSRFEPSPAVSKKFDVVAILSGPEPQRSLLENTLISQLKSSGLRYRLVRGLPQLPDTQSTNEVINFLPSAQLQQLIAGADLVISRSGYSTVMDMCAMQKKVVFIPTPGQTEQEYLSRRLMEKGIAFFMKQSEFRLSTAISESKRYSGFSAMPNNSILKGVVAKFVR